MKASYWVLLLAVACALAVPFELQHGVLLCWEVFTGAVGALCIAVFAGMNQRTGVMGMFLALAGALMVFTVFAVPSPPSRLVLVTALVR